MKTLIFSSCIALVATVAAAQSDRNAKCLAIKDAAQMQKCLEAKSESAADKCSTQPTSGFYADCVNEELQKQKL